MSAVIKQEANQESVVKYSHSESALKKLAKKHTKITTAEGPKNYKAVMTALADFRVVRVEIEKERKEKKAAILQAGRDLDGKAKELQAIIEPEETRLKELRQVVDDEKARIEAERVAALDARVEAIRSMTNLQIMALEIDESFGERQIEAQTAADKRLLDLAEEARIEAERVAFEEKQAEAARLQAIEDERLAKERAELEAAKAEQAEIEREAAAKRQAEQDKIDEQNAAIKAQQQAEQDKIDAERKKVEDDKRAVQLEKDRQRIAKEEKERAEREHAEQLEIQAALKASALAAMPDAEKAIAYVNELLSVEAPKIKNTKIFAELQALAGHIYSGKGTIEKISKAIEKAAA